MKIECLASGGRIWEGSSNAGKLRKIEAETVGEVRKAVRLRVSESVSARESS